MDVKPEGGPRAYVGHLISIAFPTLGTKNLDLKVGTFAFSRGGIGRSHIIPYARLLLEISLIKGANYQHCTASHVRMSTSTYALVKTNL